MAQHRRMAEGVGGLGVKGQLLAVGFSGQAFDYKIKAVTACIYSKFTMNRL